VWSSDQKSDWILQQLRRTLRRAERVSPYYRELFAGCGFDADSKFTFDEFARLPVLERSDIQEGGERLFSSELPACLRRSNSTGGSTGQPVSIQVGPEENGWRESGSQFFMDRLGLPRGTRTALLWGHSLDPVKGDGLLDRMRAFVGNFRYFDCFRMSPDVMDRYHSEMERWQPVCVVAYASALAMFADHLFERNWVPTYPASCLITGAEKLYDEQRERVGRVFGRPVYERYGSRDVGLIGFAHDATSSWYEVDWCNLLIEPESKAETADILVTKLHADGMPMIRYRVGDVAHFPAGSAPGHPAFALREVLGRAADRLWLPDGSQVSGLEFPHILKDYPVREFQLLQNEDYSVELFLIPKQGFTKTHNDSIVRVVGQNVPGVVLTVRIVDHIQRTASNKWRPVISKAKRVECLS
jgi:phenylacetate-CoA ligase